MIDDVDSSSDSDTPLQKRKRPAVKRKVIEEDEDSSSGSDRPLAAKKRTANGSNGHARAKKTPNYKEASSESDSDAPLV
jgi:hypothetical protein